MSELVPLSPAERAGVEPAFLDRLLELGILTPGEAGELSATDVRRVRILDALNSAGLPLEALATALADGDLSLEFVSQPTYDRYAAHVETTLGDVAAQGRVPLELLVALREAMGSPQAGPEDRLRETELPVVRGLEQVLRYGVRPVVLARALRVYADNLRRVAETEADWWASDIIAPLYRSGMPPAEVDRRTAVFSTELSRYGDELILAVFHAMQANAWMRNILEGFESVLVRRGLHTPSERPAAICFLDISGFTRMTEERGDRAAVELSRALGDIVRRCSARHGGRPVKWLGDGVMFHFPEPDGAVLAALEMVQAAGDSGLPPAHVGIHAGPVLYREGDFFGRTVNAASRIVDYARRGEVLVSQDVVDATRTPDVAYEELGPVDLKGLAQALTLHRARRPSRADPLG